MKRMTNDKSTEIEFVNELPPRRRNAAQSKREQGAQLAAQLMSRPGQWAKIRTYPAGKEASAHSYASQCRNGKSGWFQKGSAFEVEPRTLEGGGAVIYARYNAVSVPSHVTSPFVAA